MNLFNLIAKITLDKKDYEKGMNSAEKQGKSFGEKISAGAKIAAKGMAALFTGTVAVAAALAKVTLSAVSYGDEIGKESQKINMSTDAYQKWAMALGMAGTDISSMSMGMKTFTGILDGASHGQADSLLMLNKLGLGYKDFENLSVEDSLKKVVEQFQAMEQGADKTQLAVDLFGRTGQELLPLLNQEKGSIDELFKSYEDLGLIISDEVVKSSENLDDQMSLLKQKFKIVGVGIGTVFMPALGKVITGLMSLAQGSSNAGQQLKDGITGALNAVIGYLPKIAEFATQIIPVIVDTIFSVLPDLLTAAVSIVTTLAGFLIEYLPELIPAAVEMILTLVQGLLDNLPSLIDTAIDLILAIVDGLIASLPIIIEMAPEIIESLINGIVYALPKLFEAAIAIIMSLAEYLLSPEGIALLVNSAILIIGALVTGMINNVSNIIAVVPKMFETLKTAFTNMDWKGIGRNIIDGISKGISNGAASLKDTLVNAGNDALAGLKDFFGIKSPSKLMRDQIGKYIPQGIAVGVEQEMPKSSKDIQNSIKKNMDAENIVNGVNSALKFNMGTGQTNTAVQVFIGGKEFKDYTYNTVNEGMTQRGLKKLGTVGGYNN